MRFCAILKAFWAILEVVGDKEVGELTALRLACFSELPPSFAKDQSFVTRSMLTETHSN